MNFYVTHKTNVLVSEDGQGYTLQDTDDIGLLSKTTLIPVGSVDEHGVPQMGIITKAEVFWEKKRYPAPHIEDPEDLFWLEAIKSDDSDEDEEEYDDDDQPEENDENESEG